MGIPSRNRHPDPFIDCYTASMSKKVKSADKSVQHKSKVALLIIDMLNPLDFKEGPQIYPAALKAAKAIAKLKKKAKACGGPVIYVNDNFQQWQSDWKALYEYCTKEKCLGREIAELLKPDPDDYFVLKPKHSGFHETTLEILLKHMRTDRLILTGIAGNICVLFTAHDALMREFEVVVPRDCIASNTKLDNQFALRQFSQVFKINIKKSDLMTKRDLS
jgi:nicotinamidase-related amidase